MRVIKVSPVLVFCKRTAARRKPTPLALRSCPLMLVSAAVETTTVKAFDISEVSPSDCAALAVDVALIVSSAVGFAGLPIDVAVAVIISPATSVSEALKFPFPAPSVVTLTDAT